jgi:LPXTG-motif cell wall-anchored protein
MGSKLGSVIIALSSIALVMMSSSASAQFLDDGPTRSDFTENGVFDVEGYTAALISFQSAPVLTIDGPITLSVRGCARGQSLSAEFVGHPGSEVSVTSVGDPTATVVTPPSGIDRGFNVIRLNCSGASSATIIRDIIVNLQPAGTPGVMSSLAVDLLSTSGGGALPTTGSDERTILGLAAAALLLGGAVTFGAQRRFSSAN